MASFKSVPCWRNWTVGWGSCSMDTKSARIIEMRSLVDVVETEQNIRKNLIVLLVRVTRVVGM